MGATDEGDSSGIGRFDRNGEPISWEEWSRRFEDPAYKQVARDEIGKVTVSTVWVGFNMAAVGEPQFFETMIFGGPMHRTCWRYGSEFEAVAGHHTLVQQAKDASVQQTKDALKEKGDGER